MEKCNWGAHVCVGATVCRYNVAWKRIRKCGKYYTRKRKRWQIKEWHRKNEEWSWDHGFLLRTISVVHEKAHDNWQKARSETLKKQLISDVNNSWWFFRQFYCLEGPLVKKISLWLQIPFSVGCTVGFHIQNMSENKFLSEIVESHVLKRKLDFILEYVVKKSKQY